MKNRGKKQNYRLAESKGQEPGFLSLFLSGCYFHTDEKQTHCMKIPQLNQLECKQGSWCFYHPKLHIYWKKRKTEIMESINDPPTKAYKNQLGNRHMKQKPEFCQNEEDIGLRWALTTERDRVTGWEKAK